MTLPFLRQPWRLRRLLTYGVVALLSVVATVWLIRGMQSRALPDVMPWHLPALSSEFRARDYPDGIRFDAYLELEQQLERELQAFVQTDVDVAQSNKGFRYMNDSPLNPLEFDKNYNWSYVLAHDAPRGAVVLIHGASDSPYSMRALAERLHADGLSAIAVRLPGHGTLPGELVRASAEDWRAITRSAAAYASELAGADRPVYLVGYSMGAALAIDYTLDAVSGTAAPVPAGVILVSPAISLNPLVALARLDLWVSRVPGFDKFAWTDIVPEFDPYKYNSFPKQAGRQTYLLTASNEARIERLGESDSLQSFPPVITFMSVVDATVSVTAVVDNLYEHLPSNDSALVIFGVNRTDGALGFLKDDYSAVVDSVRSRTERRYDFTVLSNASETSRDVWAYTDCAGNACKREAPLDIAWPPSVFSLSHVALPFAPDDPFYGSVPGPESPGDFTLGSLQPRGERSVLVIPTEQLMRLRYNPFMPFMLDRVSAFCHRLPVSSERFIR